MTLAYNTRPFEQNKLSFLDKKVKSQFYLGRMKFTVKKNEKFTLNVDTFFREINYYDESGVFTKFV